MRVPTLPSLIPTPAPLSLSEVSCVLQWGELGNAQGLLLLKPLESESANGSRRHHQVLSH